MLNISKTIYAGYDVVSQKYELPEAEIIPIGTSSNEQKKIANIKKRYSSLAEYDNIPLPGFTLYKTNRKNYGSTDQTWLIIDPRGFLTRITSDNLEKILNITGITEGLIQQKCVWARENTETKLTLVPINSNNYKEATVNTEMLETKVSMKSVQIGDTVLLQNKLIGKYLGVVTLYGPVSDYSSSKHYSPNVMPRRQIIEVTPGRYHHNTNLKILKILSKATTSTPTSKDDAIKYINSSISTGVSFFTNYTNLNGVNYGSQGRVKLALAGNPADVELSTEEITKDEAILLFNTALLTADIGELLIEDAAKKQFIIEFPYYSAASQFGIHNFSVLPALVTDKKIIVEGRRHLIHTDLSLFVNSIDNYKKYYKILKTVKNHTYI